MGGLRGQICLALLLVISTVFTGFAHGSCSVSLTPSFFHVGVTGGSGTSSVTTDSACVWTTTSTGNLTVTPASGTGPGNLRFTVATNYDMYGTTCPRYHYVTVNGSTISILQDGSIVVSVSPTTLNVTASGGTTGFNLSYGSVCTGGVSSSDTWISPTYNKSAAWVSVNISNNNSVRPRQGTVSISGTETKVTVYQAGMPDVTAPSITAFSLPETATSLTVPVTVAATDDLDVTGYFLSESSAVPAATAVGWTLQPSSFLFASSGSRTLYVWAKDAAGNVSTASTATVQIENVPPVVTDFTAPSSSNTLDVSFTFAASDNAGVTGYMVTETSVRPAYGSSAWSATPPTGYTFSSSGSKTLYAWAKDAAGNVSAGKSITISVENVAPVVTAFTMPAISNSLTVPVSTFIASDNVAVTGYLLTETSNKPSYGSTGWTSTPPTSYTFTSSGNRILYAWAKDAAGNVSGSAAASTLVDTTPPTVTAFTTPVRSPSYEISISSLTATDNIGVTGYMVTETYAAPTPDAAGWVSTPPATYTFQVQGSRTLYVWAKDAAGNISARKSNTIIVDVTPPTVTTFTLPATANTLTVTISLSGTDNIGVVAAYLLQESDVTPTAADSRWQSSKPTQFTFPSSGTRTLYVWAKDATGNISEPRSATVSIENTPPVITAFVVPSRTTTLSATFTTLTATDNASSVLSYCITEVPDAAGCSWSTVKPTYYTFDTQGDKTLYAWVRDQAANVSEGIPASVTVDTRDITVTAFTLPETSTSLTVPVTTFTAYDNVAVTGYYLSESAFKPVSWDSGWSSTAPASYTFKAAGLKYLYAYAKDGSGNVSAYVRATVFIDTTPPAITAFLLPSVSNSLMVPVSSFTAGDNDAVYGYLASESATPPSADDPRWSSNPAHSIVFTSSGPKTVYGWVKDRAGNISAGASAAVLVDTTPPTVSAFTVPGVSNSLTVPISRFSGNDDISLSGYFVSEDPAPPSPTAEGWSGSPPGNYLFTTAGSKTLYAWTRDAAGNISTALPATVLVDLSPPVVTLFTAGGVSGKTVSLTGFSASDNHKVEAYLVTENPTAPSITDAGWSAGPMSSFEVEDYGSRTLYGWAKDAAGNVSSPATATVDVPSPPSFLLVLTVQSGGTVNSTDGLSCESATCSAEFPEGTALLLLATPSAGYSFSGWSGACSGTGNCSLLMNDATSVGAAFSLVPPVRVGETSYRSLQEAYDDPANGSGTVIRLLEGRLEETFTAGRDISVELSGGSDATFSSGNGITCISSPVVIRSGSVVIGGFCIE